MTAATNPYKQPLVEVRLNSHKRIALIDTGSCFHLIGKKDAISLGLSITNTRQRASAFGGTNITLVGQTKAQLKIGSESLDIVMQVANANTHKYVLIGFNAFWDLGLTSFDVRNGWMLVEGEPVKLCVPAKHIRQVLGCHC